MNSTETLLLTRQDVAQLLSIEECMAAVEDVFKLYALGDAPAPGILGIHAQDGGFHIKAGVMNLSKNYFVAKINANFPGNYKNGLPTIQGVVTVCDAENGRLLALMDSIEITIIRTGAATGVAAKYLAKQDAKTATICGCGNQGKISLRAVMKVRHLEKIFVFDIDERRAQQFANDLSEELEISIQPVNDLKEAVMQSDLCITCTPSKKYFLLREYISPGTFIAAVGADSEDKQELEPSLLISGKLVTDITGQCVTIGELHHALKSGIMKRSDVYAELGQIITGEKPGRTSNEEIIIFDSTGTALQDIAAAAIVCERALKSGIGIKLNFA
ncbi:MAG TPA: ornithine cyclodeaminase family protein [Chitinophagaceae bacterium]|nr:ornithine cyclodeaminase family protein [Chitinophagaceae bacterium]